MQSSHTKKLDHNKIVRYTHLLSRVQEHEYMENHIGDYEDLEKFVISGNGDNNYAI